MRICHCTQYCHDVNARRHRVVHAAARSRQSTANFQPSSDLEAELQTWSYQELLAQLKQAGWQNSSGKRMSKAELIPLLAAAMQGQDSATAAPEPPGHADAGVLASAGGNGQQGDGDDGDNVDQQDRLASIIHQLSSLSVREVQAALQQRGLPKSGNKRALVERLAEAVAAEQVNSSTCSEACAVLN